MFQLVDVVAYLVRRHIEIQSIPEDKWNGVDRLMNRGFAIIKARFDTDEFGRLNGAGIKQFPD